MMTIRDAIPSDATAIAELTIQLGYPAEKDAMRQRLVRLQDRDDHIVLVATAVDKIIAWMQAHATEVVESGFRVEIVVLVVAESCRRRGCGRALVARAEEWATSIGAGTIVVRSNVQRSESHRFYPALGYAATKTQAVYRKNLKQTPSRTPEAHRDQPA